MGIDPGTVRLVAQRLNHYATPGHTQNKTDNNVREGGIKLINPKFQF